jgi:hypothetical protein
LDRLLPILILRRDQIKEDESMEKTGVDVKSLAIGFLLGLCLLLGAAREQSPEYPVPQYRIATATSTWVINTSTGEVWQLSGEQGSCRFTWLYAGKPGIKEKDHPSPGTDY